MALLQVNKGIFTFEKRLDGFEAESLASQATLDTAAFTFSESLNVPSGRQSRSRTRRFIGVQPSENLTEEELNKTPAKRAKKRSAEYFFWRLLNLEEF